jgi:hypothetical protein
MSGRGRHRRRRHSRPRHATRQRQCCRLRGTLPVVTSAIEALKDPAPATSSGSQEQPDLRLGAWRRCATDAAIASAAHVTEMRSSTTAWFPTRWSRALRSAVYDEGRGSLHALDHLAEPACRAAGAQRVLQCAPKQAAGDRAGCRRRIRIEDLHLSRKRSSVCGPPSAPVSRSSGIRTGPKRSSPMPMAATMSRR